MTGNPEGAYPPWHPALRALCDHHAAPCPDLLPHGWQEEDSRFRYRNAEGFFAGIEAGFHKDHRDGLYVAGIVSSLAISAHLLLVGFPDAWCARYIRMYVARSLAYANVSGFGLHCGEMARLAIVLDPYWKWNQMHRYDRPVPDDGGFTVDRVRPLLSALLDHVRVVTGVPDREARP